MKETKLFWQESQNEEEKSKLEQFEENVKTSIFSVFYLLLKNQETTFWKFVLLLVIEYLQLLSFAFDQSMVVKWKSVGVVTYISQFFQTFRIVIWLEKLTWDVYVIIFYIIVFLIFVIVIDFVYVVISFKHKKFSFMQPIQILRIASLLMVTVLYVPISEFFFSISACSLGGSGLLVHTIFSTEQCFAGIHILHATASYIMFLIFGTMTFGSLVLHFENRFTKDPSAKIHSTSDLFQLLSKSIYIFIFTFFRGDQYCLFKSVVLVIFSSVTFLSYLI